MSVGLFHMALSGVAALTDAEVDAVLAASGHRDLRHKCRRGPDHRRPCSTRARRVLVTRQASCSVRRRTSERRHPVAAVHTDANQRRRLDRRRVAVATGLGDGRRPRPDRVQCRYATNSRVGPDGNLQQADRVPSGTYTVVARGNGPQAPFAVVTVEAAGTDVTGLQLVLQPPLQITGRIVATGTARPPSLAGHRLQFSALASALRAIPAQVTPATATGEFAITGLLPGQYMFSGTPFFGASADSVTWGIGSITVDGRDATDRAIDVRADALPKELIVTFTDQWQEVSGRLTNSQGAGVSDYTMLIFPTDETSWLYNSRRHLTAQPASDGRYRLGGPGPAILPAGEYYLAAVTDVSKDEQYDPAFLKSLVPASIKNHAGARPESDAGRAGAVASDQFHGSGPGTRLGPYEILSALGAGGMGEVWKARDTRLNRLVAIKASLSPFSERFEREAQAIAAVNHPHVCSLYDVGPDYLVMEYVEGESPARTRAARSGARTGRADPGRARCRARKGHRPPRLEAGQHPAHQERREGSRFRTREDPARSCGRQPQPRGNPRRFSDGGRLHPGHAAVHVAGAGRRP